MDIKQILIRLSSMYKTPYKKGDVVTNKSESYIKNFIEDSICSKYGLRFHKQGFNFRNERNLYKSRLLCRLFNSKALMDESCFSIMVYFKADKLKSGIKIDRYTRRLDVKVNSKEDRKYRKLVEEKIKEVAERLFLIKDYDVDGEEFDFNQKEDDLENKFKTFIDNRLKLLLPIYRQMCVEGIEFKQPKTLERLNPDDFDFKTLGEDGLSFKKRKRKKPKRKSKKFTRDARIKEDDEKAELGKQGEDMINRKLEKIENVLKVDWVSSNNSNNEKPNDSAGYDFKVFYKDGTISYVDVKTTASNYIFITDNELCVLKDTIKKVPLENYFVWVVDLKKKKIYTIEGEALIKSKKILMPTKYKYKINPKDFITECN